MRKLLFISLLLAPLFSHAKNNIDDALLMLNSSMESTQSTGTCWHKGERTKTASGTKLTNTLGGKMLTFPRLLVQENFMTGTKINSRTALFTEETAPTVTESNFTAGTRTERLITISGQKIKIVTSSYDIYPRRFEIRSYEPYNKCTYIFTLN